MLVRQQGIPVVVRKNSAPLVALAFLFLFTAQAPDRASASPNHPGRWTTTQGWGAPAVHMMLMPGGPSGKHSRVVWWNHGGEGPVGKVLGWDPPSDAEVNDGAFPAFSVYALEGPIPNWFCAGHTFAGDGELFVTGGDEAFEVGIRKSGFINPEADANGQFVEADDMAKRRWYPTNTLLPSGRIVTHSGSSFFTYLTVGGGNSSGSLVATVERTGMAPVAEPWETTLTPTSAGTPMNPVTETVIASANDNYYMVGGRDPSGITANVFQLARDRNVNGADYAFVATSMTTGPSARIGHVAVAISKKDFVVIGGHNDVAMAAGQVWHAHVENLGITWTQLDPASSALPGLRAPVAVFDAERIFIFGGATTVSGPATNGQLYAMKVNASSGTYSLTPLMVSGTAPTARAYATMVTDPRGHQLDALNTNPSSRYHRHLLFGGQLADGSFTNGLFALWVKDSATVHWQALAPASVPPARAHHAAAADGNSGTMIISGGEVTANVADDAVWAFDLTTVDSDQETPTWTQRTSLPQPLRGHAAVRYGTEPAFPRHPEVFDPRTPANLNSWTLLENAPRWHEWYPFGFSMPRLPGDVGDRERVFYAGPDLVSTMLEVGSGTGTWTNYGSSSGLPWQFKGGSAVLYEPGRVMKCGSRDTDGEASRGYTASINLLAPTPTWIRSDNEMIGRNNHNLVLLPDGETMVIGGGRLFANGGTVDSQTVRFPQVWNPDTSGTGWVGHWYGADPNGVRFDSTSVRKNYHTTALLMPDGRVLVAGGNEPEPDTTDNQAQIYSPWYLFGSGGPATRPVVHDSPAHVPYGRRFDIRVSVPFANIGSVALIRPGSTTHGFDQNQRYVRLTGLTDKGPAAAGGYLLCVDAPADSFVAPPGDYMLFVLNTTGTPAVAPWVRLERFNGRPSRVTDLDMVAGTYPGGDNGLSVDWSPPADDSLGLCRGAATQYEVRWRYGSIANWSQWASSTLVPNPPAPGTPGGARQSVRLSNLTPDAAVSVGLVSRNNASATGNWSALSNILTIYLSGGGGEGGGEGEIQHATGGEAAMLAGSESSAIAPDPFQKNTLFRAAPDGETSTDRIPLPQGPHWESGRAQVRLGRWGGGSLVVRSAKLIAVDHTEGVVYSSGESFVAGAFTPALSLMSDRGEDVGAALAPGAGLSLRAGSFMDVDLGLPSAQAILLRTSDDVRATEGSATGVAVQVPDGSGWTTIRTVVPRELPTDEVVPLPGTSRVRLLGLGGSLVHAVGRMAALDDPVQQTTNEPVALRHSRLGELPATFGSAGVTIGGGESLIAEFTPGDAPAGSKREWFLEVNGVQSSGHIAMGSGEISLRDTEAEGTPVVFALHPALPNPSAGSVVFAFDLPRPSGVRVEVFDLLGRRLATVTDAAWPAGRHRVAWDSRSGANLLPPGIYSVRLSTPEFGARRQFVRVR